MFRSLSLFVIPILLLQNIISTSTTNAFSAASSSSSSTTRTTTATTSDVAEKMEEVVKTYFRGVHEKDPIMIRSCFDETASIRDVCGINDDKRTVSADVLVQRCMEFVTAHPDVVINFHYGPICDRNTEWVIAHWYETGTWSGTSCNVLPPNPPQSMAVEGQTRFKVCPDTLKIQEFVVTRTFTEWENIMLQQQQQQK